MDVKGNTMTGLRLITCTLFFLLVACAQKSPTLDATRSFNPQNAQENEPAAPAISVKPLEGGLATTEAVETPNKIISTKMDRRVAEKVTGINSWEVSGAMAARNKNKGWSAAVNWLQQGPNRYQIRLSGPLGGGTVIITKNGSVVTLKDGAKSASSGNAETLLKKQTGVSIPVSNLFYWVRGIKAPGAAQSEKRDQYGRLTQLRQAGFVIDYLQYTSAGKAILPGIIRMQGNGVFIKLVIKRWKF